MKDGLWGRFHKNGELKQEENYNNGKLISISKFYNNLNEVLEKGSFDKGNGEKLDYYDNGKIFARSNYKNGYLNGAYFEYHPNGRVSIEGQYNLNNKAGTWIEYSKRGLKINSQKYD